MRLALDGRPENLQEEPEGLVTIRIDAETGKRADLDTRKSLFEVFREENAPAELAVVKNLDQRRPPVWWSARPRPKTKSSKTSSKLHARFKLIVIASCLASL